MRKSPFSGRNGAGKSTLLQMLAGMRIAQQGQVLLDNINIGQLDPADLRHDMGLLEPDRTTVLWFAAGKPHHGDAGGQR